ncbi:MAG: GNAT family N-acetyltransferase [Candidatus Nanopelagicales bacterium]
MTLTPSLHALRVLGRADRDAALELLARDPVAHVFVASRILHGSSAARWSIGGELWGWVEDGELRSMCFAGANLVPVEATPAALAAFVERGRRQGRHCSSIVGPAGDVLALWGGLAISWSPAREVRRSQPLMAITGEPVIEADPRVRPVRPQELDVVLPASIAMFTEEVGVSPLVGDGGGLYRNRVAELIDGGRSFAWIEDGTVVFKAELGAVSDVAVQVQGVWVDPNRRGQGLAAPCMAAVVQWAQDQFASTVSLYVNDYNVAARRAYLRTGFRDVGTFATVLF